MDEQNNDDHFHLPPTAIGTSSGSGKEKHDENNPPEMSVEPSEVAHMLRFFGVVIPMIVVYAMHEQLALPIIVTTATLAGVETGRTAISFDMWLKNRQLKKQHLPLMTPADHLKKKRFKQAVYYSSKVIHGAVRWMLTGKIKSNPKPVKPASNVHYLHVKPRQNSR